MSLDKQLETMSLDTQLETMSLDTQLATMSLDTQLATMSLDTQLETMSLDTQLATMLLDTHHCLSCNSCKSNCVMAWSFLIAASLSRFSSSCCSRSSSRRCRWISASSRCFSRKKAMYAAVVVSTLRRFDVVAPLPEKSAINHVWWSNYLFAFLSTNSYLLWTVWTNYEGNFFYMTEGCKYNLCQTKK